MTPLPSWDASMSGLPIWSFCQAFSLQLVSSKVDSEGGKEHGEKEGGQWLKSFLSLPLIPLSYNSSHPPHHLLAHLNAKSTDSFLKAIAGSRVTLTYTVPYWFHLWGYVFFYS